MPSPPKAHKDVVRLMKYIVNPNKTTGEECIYVNSSFCSLPTAASEFKMERERWDKHSGNYAYHIEQSFKPGEVTADIAHECGIEFAKQLFGDEFQFIIGTHLDKEHIHNHICVNAVSRTNGRKLQTDHKFINKMRSINDSVCTQHSLSVIDTSKSGSGKTYAEWIISKNNGFTWRGAIRSDIDGLLSKCRTLKDLLNFLENDLNYKIKYGEHISVSPPGTNSFFRLYKLGKGYSEEELAHRLIFSSDVTKYNQNIILKGKKKQYRYRGKYQRIFKTRKSTLEVSYYIYLHRLRKIFNSPPQYKKRMPFEVRADVEKIQSFAAECKLLSTYKIHNVFELTKHYEKLKTECISLVEEKKELKMKLRKTESPQEMKEIEHKIKTIQISLKKNHQEIKACNSIYERSMSIKQKNDQIIKSEKGMIENVSRSRSYGYHRQSINERT